MPAIIIPTTVESTPTTFTPAFTFIAQTNDFDDVFACASMLSGKTIDEVRDIAIAKTKHSARGPYYLGETQIAALLAQLGLVATVYKEIGRVANDAPCHTCLINRFKERCTPALVRKDALDVVARFMDF